MIKQFLRIALLLFAAILTPLLVLAGSIADADALYEQGGTVNLFNAINMCETFLEKSPENFEGNWKCARACREYGENAKKSNYDGWEQICAEYGKKGMKYASKAKALDPNHPAGYYFYGLNAGIYSDGTSIITAVKEGLKNKTQSSFEKVYELDKAYEEAGAILALGRFWAVLPWPLYDKKKALNYYREFQQTEYFQSSIEGRVYLSELLIALGGDRNKAEAKDLLTQSVQAGEPYFRNWAQRLLDKIR
ncbi:MAG: hypothetical protein HGJ94_17500 [Desulfosarcina sp.]|nr:hypothetical protein [Desulfosarcina sp.]MBC2743046.1 hypothetical protein [Desulfosarcina sp.]MBC2765956.1 hypothetical protein [Desulfosarcina sp.]